MSHAIRCDVCDKGRYEARTLAEYDASSLLGVDRVTLLRVPALVCSRCGAVMLDGAALDRAMDGLTVVLAKSDGRLRPAEVKFLRGALDMTQQVLARRLGVHRTTVARWEIGEVPMGQAESMALRALAAMRVLAERPKLARDVAGSFAKPAAARAARRYEIRIGVA